MTRLPLPAGSQEVGQGDLGTRRKGPRNQQPATRNQQPATKNQTSRIKNPYVVEKRKTIKKPESLNGFYKS